MINFDFDVLRGLLTNVSSRVSRNNVSCDCPFCGKEKHMFINIKTFLFDCKLCKTEGNLFTLLKHFNALHLLGGSLVVLDEKLHRISKDDEFEEELSLIDDQKCRLPIGSKRLYFDDNSDFSKYLISRKLTEIDFELYNPVKTDLKSKFKNYVIIPITKDFENKAYIGRYIGDAKKDNKLRYQNSKSEFSKLLFGFDEITNTTTDLIIVEGAYDKTSVTSELQLHYQNEWKCICTFGNKITDFQTKLLKNSTNVKNIWLMYDGRDSVNIMKKHSAILDQYFNVRVSYMYEKDPGDSNQDEIINALDRSKDYSEFYYDRLHRRKFS